MIESKIPRAFAIDRVSRSFQVHPAVAVVGPRQCGKTTLARMFTHNDPQASIFDLEKYTDRRLMDNAESILLGLSGTVVIDEIQRVPELFEVMRVVIDNPKCNAQFLVLGSVSPTLIKGVSESLAGRIGIEYLSGFSSDEVPDIHWHTLWFRGGFPRSVLADDDELSAIWRESFVATFLERDVPQYGITVPPDTLRRFWTMLAHYHGQVWNGAEFARAIGQSEITARRYLDILSSAFMVRVLAPWHENLKKRQVKSPKIYIRDSGILHSLLELNSRRGVLSHPKAGASFEGMVIEHIINRLRSRSCYFWGTHGGAELDLLVIVNGKRYGFEIKYRDSISTTRSMRSAIQDLKLEHLWIVHPGAENYQLDETISTVSFERITTLVDRLKQGKAHLQ